MKGLLTFSLKKINKNMFILHFSREQGEVREKKTITPGELKLMKEGTTKGIKRVKILEGIWAGSSVKILAQSTDMG